MARFEKYSGAQSLPGVRRPQVIADTAVGAETAALGRQIQRSAGQADRLAHLAQKRQQQIDDFERSKAHRQLLAYVRDRQAEELRNLRPGAAGYTEAMLAHLEKGREEALGTLPESVHASFNREFEATHARHAHRFAAREHAEYRAYFRQGFRDLSRLLAAEVSESPGMLDEVRLEGASVLANMPLSAQAKEEALLELDELLATTWVEALPLEEQVVALERELQRRRKPQAGDVGEAGDAGNASGAPSSGKTSEPLSILPDMALKRLHEAAVKQRTTAAATEAERIARKIAVEHGHIDPAEIADNSLLQPHQKAQLIRGLEDSVAKREKDIEALQWVWSSGPEEEGDKTRGELADRAFSYLDDGETDRDELARGLLRMKGVLPGPYALSLRQELASKDPRDVANAHENLARILAINPDAVQASEQGKYLLEAKARWHLLTDHSGFTAEEAAEKLARMNDLEKQAVFEQVPGNGPASHLLG
ncbi:hypothetical protein [Labrenzia sp. 011]|uniref:hypothetical protein n=1 Tax=Labrenzia sp. 011 TaxID=2171494 RepID=UPI000D5145FD|nr:hypothetical protein [Labrenzia sp. 011]PVB59309.1 hypothetical protein DCO57_22715 [Labrenzia sp. 011]